MPKKVAIGIDLGTTNSCVAVFRNGKVDLIANESGSRVTPSFVAFEGDNVHVGEAAKLQSSDNPKNSVFEVKRLIGRRYADPTVQDDIKNWPFEVIDDDGAPMIKVQLEYEKEKCFKPEEISARVLMKLKKTAETYIGSEIQDAVITVPAYFSDSQRQATIDAGKIACLNVLSIINEPTAAAIAYGVDKKNIQEQTVLVFDFGGGTFDVSILSIANNEYIVKGVGGDTHLGGSDIDMVLVDHFLKVLKTKHGKDISTHPRHVWRLRQSCEQAKIFLSTASGHQAKVVLHGILDGDDFQENLLRSKFEQLNMGLFNKTMKHVKNVLKDAEMDKSEIDEVVLVGGSSRIPKIQEMLRNFFDGKKLNSTINPDETVAYGAAVKAALSSGEHTIEEITLTDVVSLSLGTDNNRGEMVTFIKKNTRIPATAVQKNWTTVTDYQTKVKVDVFEGERTLAKNNNLLGTFDLLLGEKEMAGVAELTFTFTVDENGILNVSGENKNTKSTTGITISSNKGRLEKKEIERMVMDARQLRIA